jgi:hypothetical protein
MLENIRGIQNVTAFPELICCKKGNLIIYPIPKSRRY